MAPTNPQRVVIAGGSGFLGRGLTAALLDAGQEVTILSRSPQQPAGLPPAVDWQTWDGKTLGPWASRLDHAAALVNFVGKSVDCRKTPDNVREILESRVDSCRMLGEACRSVSHPPPVWIQSATAHIVGDPRPKDTICDESTPPGPQDEMAPRVGVAWEQAFADAKLPEQRGVVLRISFVLAHDGGAMDRLKMITKLGLGGTVGPGDQWISWLHRDDLDRLILQAIADDQFAGTYVVTAPEPVTNRQFMAELRKAYHRPWFPPAPPLGVRLASRFVLNTDPELALEGRRCVPTRLTQDHGFTFQHPDLPEALATVRRRETAADR